jgi:hypothetical protein
MKPFTILVLLVGVSMTLYSQPPVSRRPVRQDWMETAVDASVKALVVRYGESQRARAQHGVDQVAEFWRASDGDAAAFRQFAEIQFAGTAAARDTMFTRIEALLEKLDGHMAEIGRGFREQSDLDLGPMLPFDDLFAGYDASAHINDDFFSNKIAFTVLLNFPLTTLEERLAHGSTWTRRQWAETKLAQRFSKRIPADVSLAIAQASSEAETYIAGYNIWMHHLVNEKGDRLFPAKLRLLSHWNLRDEIKADYADAANGLAKQRTIQRVMEAIVAQSIPGIVVNNPHVDWNPFTNEVAAATVNDAGAAPPAGAPITNVPEPNTRYATLLKTFQASMKADQYSPTAPTLIDRRFNEDRQLPEARVKKILEDVLTSPLAKEVGAMIAQRLGRPLEPFDIWYNGFRPRSKYSESDLDRIVSKKYPNANAYAKKIPAMLVKLGFSKERAQYLAAHIAVDPARGSGHAMGAAMRGVPAHLRTRIEKSGMNYKGFNIAVHEMGHNVEQTFSLNSIDHTLLQGVPNTAFTEAIAFVFQANDMKVLGLSETDPQAEALKTVNDYWMTFEIAGVALVDMQVWHWMYDHPAATPAELNAATQSIAKEIWNTFYAPVFNRRDVVLLGVYSHMIHSFLYLPDYPLGHMIAFQIEAKIKQSGNLGAEVERMATIGSIAPDLWMTQATGTPVGPDALLDAAAKAVARINTHH